MSRDRAPARSTLGTVAVAVLAVNAGLLFGYQAVRGNAPYDATLGWVGNLAMFVPTAACFARAAVGGSRRAAAIWLGCAMLAQTAGNVIMVTWTQLQVAPPAPAPSDFAYWAFYLCVIAAVVCLVRTDAGSFPRSLWLDGALGAAGAATALAAVLSPVLAGSGGPLAVVLVGAGYTVGDLLLVAMICGLLAVRGTRGASLWLWLAGGLALFCAADVTYALRVEAGTYTVASMLHVMWMLGVTCIAVGI